MTRNTCQLYSLCTNILKMLIVTFGSAVGLNKEGDSKIADGLTIPDSDANI